MGKVQSLSTNTATPTKATYSWWFKGTDNGVQQGHWGWHRANDASNYWLGCYKSSNGSIYFNWKQGGSSIATLGSEQKFNDSTGWTHMVITIDTTLATAADRVKMYVNGVRNEWFEDSLDTISQNAVIQCWSNAQDQLEVGTDYIAGGAHPFKGYLSHWHFCDGYAYQASSFGSFDSTTGIWKANADPSVSYGSEGRFLKFADASNLGLDSSGNSKNMTKYGNVIHANDTPSNNFPVLNSDWLSNSQAPAFSNYYTTVNMPDNNWRTTPGTIALTKGKWYFELSSHAQSANYVHVGISSITKLNHGGDSYGINGEIQSGTSYYAYGYYGNNGNMYYSNNSSSTSTSYGAAYANSDVIGCYIDLDNNKLYFAKNGTIQNSGTGFTIEGTSNYNVQAYYPVVSNYGNGTSNVNFGNGTNGANQLTGTTYADANGEGEFKYNPSTGTFDGSSKNFYAICTNNINLYGGSN